MGVGLCSVPMRLCRPPRPHPSECPSGTVWGPRPPHTRERTRVHSLMLAGRFGVQTAAPPSKASDTADALRGSWDSEPCVTYTGQHDPVGRSVTSSRRQSRNCRPGASGRAAASQNRSHSAVDPARPGADGLARGLRQTIHAEGLSELPGSAPSYT